MRINNKCGYKNHKDSQRGEMSGAPSNRKRKTIVRLIILFLVLLLVDAGLWYFLANKGGNDSKSYKDPVTPVSTPKVPRFTVSVESLNPDMGTVSGGGTYDSLASVTIEAIACDGYRFVKWNDENNKAKRSINVVGNQIYIAVFEKIANKPVETATAYDLGWGNYTEGPRNKEGVPHGRPGKIVVTKTHSFLDASGNTITVYPGETITGTKFDKGILISGEIHRKDGGHLLFMADY